MEELDQESQRIWDDAGGGDDQTPKVQATEPLECDENEDDEFDRIVQRKTQQKRDDDL